MDRFLLVAALALSACSHGPLATGRRSVASFAVSSPAFAAGGRLPPESVFNAFGCTGGNASPALAWSGAPAGIRSYAVTLYDPDAPTGSGFWHWVVTNLPASTTSLAAGASGTGLPAGAVEGRSDFGTGGYSGPCPPEGAPAHRYVFTVHALDVERLDLPSDASGAFVGFNLYAHDLARATLTTRYGR